MAPPAGFMQHYTSVFCPIPGVSNVKKNADQIFAYTSPQQNIRIEWSILKSHTQNKLMMIFKNMNFSKNSLDLKFSHANLIL